MSYCCIGLGEIENEREMADKELDRTIGVGFSSSRVSLNRLPGWEPDSWAYHSDDGRSFCCSSTGKDYGPQFDVGDVIGCGLNFRTKSAFFTRNGIYLGTSNSSALDSTQFKLTCIQELPFETLKVINCTHQSV